MDAEKLVHYEYIRTILDTKIDEKLISLFNAYISANKEFKYNRTYLDDSIDHFKLCISIFKEKAIPKLQ